PSPFRRGDASIAGKPGVILAISKQPGADSRDLARAIDAEAARLAASLPNLRFDTEIFRQSRFIDRSIANIREALRDGSILVAIVLLAFLASLRATVVTLAALPLSILCTFVAFGLLGQSVNTMTLGGIAIATGELVDDAVVGVENIHRRLRAASVLAPI